MSQLTDQMAADASARLSLWIARSAGQRKRSVHKSFEQIILKGLYEHLALFPVDVPFLSAGAQPDCGRLSGGKSGA